jgi:hypothetical protein
VGTLIGSIDYHATLLLKQILETSNVQMMRNIDLTKALKVMAVQGNWGGLIP